MTKGETYLDGFELLKEIIEMLHGKSKVALSKNTANQALSMMPILKSKLPDDAYIGFYVERLIPAFDALSNYPTEMLDNTTKEILVSAFTQLKMSLANFLYNHYETDPIDVTPRRVPLLREIVSTTMLGEEID